MKNLIASTGSLPCLQVYRPETWWVGVGCERSERREPSIAINFDLPTCSSPECANNTQLYAKAQATPPQPSPTIVGEGANTMAFDES